ncbi:glycosyltransferase [Tunicatimonas pelagia]|uniref:glycosyltransferase n=1 Tax=Tunicatimonas pelagia TaxID=931531 RepID=UPI002665FF30|nr:glycosyltransferase [Tunicatimonas pelagia]WKN40983.1 glycosyltransferase [Tunicatimonas pelagia]
MYSKRIIARIDQNSYPPHCNYLINQHNFQDVFLYAHRSKRIKSKLKILTDNVSYAWYVLKHRKKFSRADIIISTGWIPLSLRLLIKLGIVSCNKFYWLGFQIHEPKLYRYFALLLRLTSLKRETYIVNAFYEKDIYAKRMGISPEKIQVLPYSDWGKDVEKNTVPLKNYYFAGGYTNRDYASLIDVFSRSNQELVIIGSKHNHDLDVAVPDNIKILKDVNKKDFISYLVQAKACIVPLKKADAGASGQMVLLSYMRNTKTIIASDYPSVREYVTHNTSALLYDKQEQNLASMVAYLEENPDTMNHLKEKAFRAYQENFSHDAIAKRLDDILSLQ